MIESVFDKHLVILLHGEPGAGKDAIAKILVEQHGFIRLAFADKLKEMCEALDPIVGYEKYDDHPIGAPFHDDEVTHRLTDVVRIYGWDNAKRLYPEVRRTQQRLATEVVRRHVGETFWADHVLNEIKRTAPKPIVVTDMRFQSELDTIKDPWGPLHQADVRTWWVERPDNPLRIEGDNATHVSEVWHPEESESFVNDGNLHDLEVEVGIWIRTR